MTFRPKSEKHIFKNKSKRVVARRERATQRQEARATRTNLQQIAVLEDRGITGGREFDRLLSDISN